MGGRNAVFDFYRQLSSPFKQGRKKLGIICVLCAKELDDTNYDQWTWVNCARVVTNNTTNLPFHLENKHAGVASVKALVSNKKKKVLVESELATVHSIGSSPNTRVTSSITVTMKKSSVELVKHDVFCWIVGSGTTFGKTQSTAVCRIFKPISGYTGLGDRRRASCATCGMTVTISYLKSRMESSHGICVPQTRGVDEVWRGPTMYVVSLPKVLQEAISPVPGCPAVAYSVGRLFEHFMFCHFRSKVAVVQ